MTRLRRVRPPRALAAVLAASLAWSQAGPAALAAEFRVFRKTYLRGSDTPVTETDAFSVLNPAADWRLRAINGSLEDAAVEKVSSSTASLNGVEVLRPSQFNQTVSMIEVPVSLRSANTLAVQVRGKPGGRLTIEMLGRDDAPPSAEWLSPDAGLITNGDGIAASLRLADDVSGLDPASLAIRLNGADAAGSFGPPLAQPAIEAALGAELSILDEGSHILFAEVRDLAGQPASASVSFVVDRTPPTLSGIAPADGALLDTARPLIAADFTDTLSGVDPASVRLRLDGADVTAQAQVTAAGARFEPAVDLADGAHTAEVHAADRAGNAATAQTRFTVRTIIEPPASPTTGLIHGQVFDHGADQPLPGARVTAAGIDGEQRTDAQGRFVFPAPAGVVDLNIQQPGYASVQRRAQVEAGRHTSVAPAFLTPLDPAVTPITRAAGGLARDSTATVELSFPAGAAPHDLDVRITPLPMDAQLPGPMPPGQAHVGGVYFEPRFTAFDQPVTMRYRNGHTLAPGTVLELAQWDDTAQAWMRVGSGQVSADGQWIQFAIIRFFCWYCIRTIATPPPGSGPPQREDVALLAPASEDPAKSCPIEGNSSVCPESGELAIEHELPGIRALGASRAPVLRYRSSAADPSALLGTDYFLHPNSLPNDAGTLVPPRTSASIQIEGRRIEASFAGAAGTTRQAFLWDGRNAAGEQVPTGAYQYAIELSNHYPATFGGSGVAAHEPASLTTRLGGRALIVNEQDSPFGAGWTLEGLQRLRPQPDGAVLVTDGDGSATLFRPGPIRDLIVTNLTGGSVSVLLGYGDGAFQSSPLPLTGLSPSWAAAGEFNGDGLADLAVALDGPDQLGVWLGGGLGGIFAEGVRLPLASNPSFLTTADLNADGRLDLLITARSSNQLVVLLGRGDGTFEPERRAAVGGSPRFAAVGDLNRDGRADVAVANTDSDDVSILLGRGDGTFEPERRIGGFTFEPRGLALADFNQDAALDLAVPHATGGTLAVLLGRGDGTFGPAVQHVVRINGQKRFGLFGVAAGDLNADGLADVAVTNFDQNDVHILLGRGDGSFRVTDQHGGAGGPGPVAMADVNGDGREDVLVVNVEDSVSVYLGNGDGTLQRGRRTPTGDVSIGLAVAELSEPLLSARRVFSGLPGDFSRLEERLDDTFARRWPDGTVAEFDPQGRHTATLDRNGNRTRYEYDAQGRLTRLEYPGGAVFDFTYDGAGRLSSIHDSAGRTTGMTVDAAGDLVALANPDGSTRRFAYDAQHRLTAKTTPRGFVTDYAYDPFGRIREVTAPPRPIFDPASGQASDGREVRRFTPADVQGLINQLPPGSGTPTSPAPAVAVPRSAYQDGRHSVTQTATDPYGAPTQIIDPLARVTSIERDAAGLPRRIVQADGRAIDLAYDGRGNLIRVEQPNNPPFSPIVTQVSYEPAFSQPAALTDPNGNATRLEYDVQGNLVRLIDALGQETALAYDSRGLLVSLTDAIGTATPEPDDHQTRFAYDPLTGNLLDTTDPLGRVTRLRYDAAGNVELVTDAAGQATRFLYDPMNRLLRVTDPLGQPTAYAYDAAGNLTRLTDATGHSTAFAYDSLEQLTRTTNPLAQAHEYAYDAARNLGRRLDPQGQTATFRYDPAGQLTTKRLADAAGVVQDTVTAAYNLVGQLIHLDDADSRLRFEYDVPRRLQRVHTGEAANAALAQPVATVEYAYDRAGQRTRLSCAACPQPTYEYDALNRLTRITSRMPPLVFSYDPLSRLTSLQTGRTRTTYTYDAAGQLLSLAHELTGSPFETISYAYDPLGNRTTRTDRFGLHTYTYDALSRLTEALLPAATGLPSPERYTYDPLGNRLASHLSATHTHDAANRLLEDDAFTYTYDAAGNRETQTDKMTGIVTRYTYDLEHRLIQVDRADGLLARYAYDALGRRIEKRVGPAVTRFLYDQEDLLVIYHATTCAALSLLHGPGIDQPLVYARDSDDGCDPFVNASGLPDTVTYLLTDGLGSVTALLQDYRGVSVLERSAYASFGTPQIHSTGPDGVLGSADDVRVAASQWANPYAFTGRELDAESGLYYYRARTYDPRTGTFLQADPIGFAGGDLNLYVYVANRPTNFIDPFGLACFSPQDGSWNDDCVFGGGGGPIRGTGGSPFQRLPSPGGGMGGGGARVRPARVPTGLRQASPGLRAVYDGGSVRGRSMIQIRETLVRHGFKQSLSDNKCGYLFQRGKEEVRLMHRDGGWDIRVKNTAGNWLDEFGNVAQDRAGSHDVPVVSQ